MAPYLYTIMDLLGLPRTRAAKVQYLTAARDSYPLPVPFVLKGDDGTKYLSEIAALARGGADGRRELNLRQNSLALLEALLAFAALEEMDKAATRELPVTPARVSALESGALRQGVRRQLAG